MKRTEHFTFISSGRSFQRKVRRQGHRTKAVVVGTPVTGYGLDVTFWKDENKLAIPR